jgi:hypothetical protein
LFLSCSYFRPEHEHGVSMLIDTDYPWAIDIPIPSAGLGPMLTVILDAAQACPGGAVVVAYREPETSEVPRWWERVATKTPADARRLARTFRSIGAKYVRAVP